MRVILSAHAAVTLEARRIPLEWVERAIRQPDQIGPDPNDPGVTRSFKRIPEACGRVLRVVHRPEGADMLVVTAFLDRGARL